MKFEKALKGRRSVRKYKDKKLSKNALGSILDAARYAPSAGNLQNWRFIVVEDGDTKNKVASGCLGQKWMTKAGALVVVCSDDGDAKRLYKEKSDFYCRQNIGAAVENMLLKAYSIGIASCWVGAFSREELRKVLKIPENINRDAVLCFGISSEKPEMSKRIELMDLVHFEEWGKLVK